MSKPIYRPLFLEAWKKSWHHKRLWVLGIFATIMASGGLFESIFGNWQTALKGREMLEQCINGTLPGYQWLVSYSRYLSMLEPRQQYTISAVVILLLLGLISLGALAQGAILVGGLEKHSLSFRELLKKSYHFFWRILGIDIIGKIGLALLFIITVAPVAFLNPLPYGWHQYPPIISLAVFLVGMIAVTTLQMLSLVGVVRKHLNISGAIHEAWDIFRFHVVVTLELGILLFITSFLATLVTMALLFILSIPLILLFVIATILGSAGFYLLSIFASIVIVVAIILLASGLLTTFQYTVWSLYFEEAGRFGIIPKIKRWFKK
ncbi:MAG: hypothetical protein WC702_02435 [Patescibacteria group bacterium]|jgi:hypothetical protein